MKIPLSILDLASVGEGSTPSQALRESLELARFGDEHGFKRHWFAEHHSMPSVASSAPEILIAHIAAATKNIRVGSGGVMLPNHVPLKLAENFHTLEALHPGRIDLGIGRAPGTDPTTIRALRSFDAANFAAQFAELQALSERSFGPEHPFHRIRVMPDDVSLPPVWILGSSGASARFAGQAGLGYSFASHFSPTDPRPAFDAYRENFEPSEKFEKPHIILAVAVICAETEEEADFLAGSWDLAMLNLRRGVLSPFPSPERARDYAYSAQERAFITGHRELQFLGTPEKVKEELEEFVASTGADELMITSFLHSHEDRLRSLKLLKEAMS